MKLVNAEAAKEFAATFFRDPVLIMAVAAVMQAMPEELLPDPAGWIRAGNPPKRDGRYLCVYRFKSNGKMYFTGVLDYYATDHVPHFQHTLGNQDMEVMAWMSVPVLPAWLPASAPGEDYKRKKEIL